jgi:hypothetical protein
MSGAALSGIGFHKPAASCNALDYSHTCDRKQIRTIFITTKLLDFVYRPDFYKPENTMVQKLDLFLHSGD